MKKVCLNCKYFVNNCEQIVKKRFREYIRVMPIYEGDCKQAFFFSIKALTASVKIRLAEAAAISMPSSFCKVFHAAVEIFADQAFLTSVGCG